MKETNDIRPIRSYVLRQGRLTKYQANAVKKFSAAWIIPFEKKPEELLQACDSFCLPSYREGFGLSVIEASALEKPIICSDAYGLADTIVQGETGLRHRVGDVDHLKKQLTFALNHPKEMRSMGKVGRKYVEDNYSEKRLLEEWENFYQKELSYKR